MIEFLGIKGNWQEVASSCNTTINKQACCGEPTSRWKTRILFSEHSPIRQLVVKAKWLDIPYWVSTHFVRHWLGIIHWVRTQRSDRTKVDRSEILQGALVEHEIETNAQAIINISKVRLCRNASPETRAKWIEFINSFKLLEGELFNQCVPTCIYRNGICPEFKTCGFNKTEQFEKELKNYIDIIKDQVRFVNE